MSKTPQELVKELKRMALLHSNTFWAIPVKEAADYIESTLPPDKTPRSRPVVATAERYL